MKENLHFRWLRNIARYDKICIFGLKSKFAKSNSRTGGIRCSAVHRFIIRNGEKHVLKIKQYVKAQSLEEAYALNQDKHNVILGGMLWLKLQNSTVETAIDLGGLGLDRIEETAEEYRIGAMVSLRKLETNAALNA